MPWYAKLGWIAAGLAAIWAILTGKRRKERDDLLVWPEEVAGAKHEAVEAQADLEKERIQHEADQAVGDIGGMPDSDIIDQALAEHGGAGQAGHDGGSGGQDPDPDS